MQREFGASPVGIVVGREGAGLQHIQARLGALESCSNGLLVGCFPVVTVVPLEGHPDNVVPALLGSCQLAARQPDQPWTICEIPWHAALVPVVAIPNFELSTAAARQVLPERYSRADAIFNASHLGLLLQGFKTGNGDWLAAALCDRIHQPYRKTLIQGYEAVWQAAIDAGAWGLVISGAGPTLLAICPPSQVEVCQQALVQTWERHGISVDARRLSIDYQGAVGTWA